MIESPNLATGTDVALTVVPPAVGPTVSLKERVIRGVLWLTATRASGQVISWIITIFVVRLLSPEDYGVMGMAVLFTGMLFLFNEIGLGAVIVQRAEISSAELSDLRWLILAVNAALCVLLALLAPAVAAYFDEPRLVAITRVLALTFLVNGIGIPSASVLQREMAFKEKSTAEAVGNVAGGITTLVLALQGYGVWSLVLGNLVIRFATNALYCLYRPPSFRPSFSAANVGLFLEFGFQVAAARILWYFASSADVMVVGKVLGSAPLGYYSLAFQYSSLPLEKFVTILNEIAFPSFSSVQGDKETLQRHYLKLVHFVAMVTFPMFVGLAVVAPSAVEVLLGARWLPIVLPLQLLCVVSCVRAIETINNPVVLAKGQPRVLVSNTLITALVLPVSFYVGAKEGGITGVAMAWLLVRPVLFAIVTYRTLRVVELSVGRYLSGVWHPIAGSLVMMAVVLGVDASLGAMSPLSRLLICSLAGCLSYLAYTMLFNLAALQDVRDTLSLRSLGLSSLRGSLPRTETHAI